MNIERYDYETQWDQFVVNRDGTICRYEQVREMEENYNHMLKAFKSLKQMLPVGTPEHCVVVATLAVIRED